MDLPEISDHAEAPEMKPIFYPGMVRVMEQRNVWLPASGSDVREYHDKGWHSLMPDMMPMPGTPDFCEFLMDGAV
jgi:hypothetical protein